MLVVIAIASPLLARGRDRRVALFALAYSIGFVIVLVPLARVLGTYFAYRRIESLVPVILLAVAIGLMGIVDRLTQLHLDRRVAYAFGAVALLVIVALSLAATLAYYDTEKSNYRELARIVHDTPADEDVVIGPSADPARILEYLEWKGVRPARRVRPGERRAARAPAAATTGHLVRGLLSRAARHDHAATERPRPDADHRGRLVGTTRDPPVVRVDRIPADPGRLRPPVERGRRSSPPAPTAEVSDRVEHRSATRPVDSGSS